MGQDLSHWEEPGGHLRDEQPGGYLREDMFVTAPERIINDELDKIPSPEVETASQFFDRKTAQLPSSSKQSEDDCFSQLDRIPSPELDLLAETASQFFA